MKPTVIYPWKIWKLNQKGEKFYTRTEEGTWTSTEK